MANDKKKPTKKTAAKGAARPSGKPVDFPIADIKFESALQPREGDASHPIGGIYRDHVEDIRAAIRRREDIPRVRIWVVEGRGNLLTDGHHTTIAYTEEGRKTIPAEVFKGSWLDAVADASGSNAEHKALKRTNEGKRQAVLNLLNELEAEGVAWSNNRIAATCRVSDDLVKAMVLRKTPTPKPDGAKVLGKDNKPQSATKKKKPKGGKPAAEPPKTPDTFSPIAAADPPKAKPSARFHLAEHESKFGAALRELDYAANEFGVPHTKETEKVRDLYRKLDTAFREWLAEAEKAYTKREAGK